MKSDFGIPNKFEFNFRFFFAVAIWPVIKIKNKTVTRISKLGIIYL